MKRLGDITRELCRAAWVKKKTERVGIAAMGSTLPFPPGAQVAETIRESDGERTNAIKVNTDTAALRASQRRPGVTVNGTPTGGDEDGVTVGAALPLGGSVRVR